MLELTRLGTCLVLVGSSISTSSSFADALPKDDDAVLEEIVVTGSRVARANFESPTPTMVVDQEMIARTGLNDVGEILRLLPEIGVGIGANNDQFSADLGASYINLRGLGTKRTLTLIDGRRRVASTSNGGTASGVDLSTIPAGMVDRIEVITGGASAVYGADAVTGVVNVILKKDFDGMQVDGRYGVSEEGDANSSYISLSGGTRFGSDRGSLGIGVTYQRDDPIFYRDRYYSDNGIFTFANNPENTGPDDGIPDFIAIEAVVPVLHYAGTFAIDGTRYTYDPGLRPLQNGTTYGALAEGGDGYNGGELALRTPREVTSALARMDYEIGSGTSLFVEAHAALVESSVNGQSFFDNALTVARENPLIPSDVGVLMDEAGLASVVLTKEQAASLGDKQYHNRRSIGTITVGVSGDIGQRWNWEAYVQSGESSKSYRLQNTRIESRFFEAIDVISDPISGDPVCRSEAARAAGCTPIGLFGTDPVSGSDKQYFIQTRVLDVNNTQQVASAQATGHVFQAPAGAAMGAVGVEWRRDELSSRDDSLAQRGLLYRTDNGGLPNDARIDVREAFAELVVPLISGKKFAEEVSIEGAVRLSNYTTVGDTVAWKVGGEWEPISFVRLRATRSLSVRAPNIIELYDAGTSGGLNIALDPCDALYIDLMPDREANCLALGVPAGWVDPVDQLVIPLALGGNPDLDEETADTWTAGVVWSPRVFSGFRLAVDYWNVEIDDAIESLSPNDIVTKCVDSESIDNPFCPLVKRGGFVGVDDAHAISRIDVRNVNVGLLRANGIDIQADASLSAERFISSLSGDFRLGITATYLNQLEELVDINDPGSLIVSAGEYDNPEWRANLDAQYSSERWEFQWTSRFIGSAEENVQASGELRSIPGVGSVVYHDLYAGWNRTSTTKLFLGINNLFDRDPPRSPDTYAGVGRGALYSNLGRFFYVGASSKF